jgi:uncharacterized protein
MPTETARPFAVVTGASTGIGYHLARVFAENGFDILITAEESRNADTARDIEFLGAKVYTVQADLTKDDEVKRLWNEILATRRPVDAIALNAGIGIAGHFTEETELETELRIIDLNVKSTVHLAKLAAEQMVGRQRAEF